MGARILVIEDEANIADYLVTGLREEGFAVEHAADGVSGRQRLDCESAGISSCSTGGCRARTAWRCSAASASATAGRPCCS